MVENSSAKPLYPRITKCKLFSVFIIHCLLLPGVGLKNKYHIINNIETTLLKNKITLYFIKKKYFIIDVPLKSIT